MGRLRKKHNWKGRQQDSETRPAPVEGKPATDVVVELKGEKQSFT